MNGTNSENEKGYKKQRSINNVFSVHTIALTFGEQVLWHNTNEMKSVAKQIKMRNGIIHKKKHTHIHIHMHTQ